MTAPPTVVVADDHSAMLAAVAEILERNGFSVVGRAADGVQAVALIEEAQPALAIVDVRMPRLGGIDVAVRAASVSARTAIVFYTAFGDRALLSEALDAGGRGSRLHISAETVRTHVRKAMQKLEADTRTQAVATALRQSIIS